MRLSSIYRETWALMKVCHNCIYFALSLLFGDTPWYNKNIPKALNILVLVKYFIFIDCWSCLLEFLIEIATLCSRVRGWLFCSVSIAHDGSDERIEKSSNKRKFPIFQLFYKKALSIKSNMSCISFFAID